ncbi:MAG TPA: pyruvate dehydrogenase complex dihydrolipoamide acetyltransferase, partial [Methylocella sp.]|nr:pyruvate dehydrogenase complex dihydrolipoamide acetyltransferase [Methylocella sp.]
MPIDILMPALSPTMEKGNLSRWLKKEGDKIKPGDVLAEIETDKAAMEVEAADEGVLAKIIVPEGTADVPVNKVIGIIAGEGEDTAAAAARGTGQALSAKESKEAFAGMPPGAPPPVQAATAPSARSAAPLSAAPLNGEAKPRLFASPLARRLAKEAGLDLAALKGSGPHGRIIERDVKAALARAPAAPAALEAKAPAAPLPAPPAATVKAYFTPGSYEEIPHDAMRRTIARRLSEANLTIPHFYLTADCNLDALMALRGAINDAAPKDKDGSPAYKISINDFIVKALALALMRVPDANVTWTDTALLRHKEAGIGVAVAIPGGLITPVVRRAESKTLSAISQEIKELAARARARKLKPEEYEGGSSAVSNLGMYGIKSFSAIINPPQSTILAVGAAEERIIVKGGAPAVSAMMSVTLSCDHRAVDGALGAELLA